MHIRPLCHLSECRTRQRGVRERGRSDSTVSQGVKPIRVVGAYGRAMPGGLMLVSPDVLPGTAKFEPWTAANDGTVVLGPDEVEDEVRLAIPEGYSVEELPDGWKKEQAPLSAKVTYRIDGAAVVLMKRLSRGAGFFQKSEYEAIRSFYRELREAERRSVLLRKPLDKGYGPRSAVLSRVCRNARSRRTACPPGEGAGQRP